MRCVATCALVFLGCSSTSSDGSRAPSRCIDNECDASPPANTERSKSAEASPKSETETGALPSICVTGPGSTTLFEGGVTNFAVGSDRVVILGDSLLSVPLAGGAPTVLATPSDPQNLFVLGSTAYYEELNPPGGVPSGGKVPLMAIPAAGGALDVFASPSPLLAEPHGAADGTSYYFTAFRAIGNVGGLSKLTPPSTTVVAETTERFLADPIVPYGDDVYFVGTDIAETTSFIARVPKGGGAVEHLVSDIGIAMSSLAVDESGLYWVQPLSRWADGIHRGAPYVVLHSALDGSSVEQILDDGASSIVAARGRLYFTTSREVDSIAATGGAITTVAENQHEPKALTISGGNLVWANDLNDADAGGVQPADVDGSVPTPVAGGKATPPTRIVTACLQN